MGIIGEGGSRSPVVPNQRERTTSEMPVTATLPLIDRHIKNTSTGIMEVLNPMLLMPNASGSTTQGPRTGPSRRFDFMSDRYLLPSLSMGTSQPLRHPLNWASVASWFFRPECSLLTTMANSDPSQLTRTSSVRPLVPSTRYTDPPMSSGGAGSPSRPSSANPTREERPERERTFQAPTICTAIRCTVPNCCCECFVPGKRHLRYCETCKHGWVPHALDKLGTRHLFTNSAPEPVQPNAAFDIASLVLYGCQALPIRLKILLDRLFSVLQKEQVLQVLHGFGWTPEDYARGYILQESQGGTLDRWSICSPEEEPLVLQQFLRFGETRAITQQLLLAQQALQDPTLERLERRSSPNTHRAMSPNRCPSPSTITSAFHPSRMPTMSPHQKHPLNFLKMSPPNGPATCSSPPISVNNNSLSASPLNRLQSMQPFDFRKLGSGLVGFPNKISTDARRRTSESDTPIGLNLSMATSLPACLPPPPPPPVSSLNHSAVAMAAAVSVNSLAAASLVASSFPGLVSTRMSVDNKSPSAVDFLGNCKTEFPSEEDDDIDENSQSALNLSRDNDALKTSRHPRSLSGRKSTTPTKRHWGSPGIPLNLGTQFINPATGKKRVQCNVCLKTFCDKGALKIHFSAVHLREMHKCTVEGCNMMFSSRRSRNRHSANPNPKLHSPHLRRKISPHDGRSAQSHPILIPPQAGLSLPAAAAALNPLNPFGPFPLLTPPPDIRHHSALASMDFKQSLDLSMQRQEESRSNALSEHNTSSITTSSHHEDEDEDDDDGIVVVGGDEEEYQEKIDNSNGISDQPEDFSMPFKRQKMSVSDVDEDMASNVDSNEDSLSVVDTQSLKDECNLPTNKRKRKNQNPTRCAVPTVMEDSVSEGDSSNDVFPDRVQEKIQDSQPQKQTEQTFSPIFSEVKREVSKSPERMSPLNLGKSSPDVNANETEKNVAEIKTSLTPLFMLDKFKKEKQPQDSEAMEETDERPASSVESNKSDESFDSSNALRHLESLSHGHFGELMSRGLHLGLGGQSSQFPPLGFMLSGGPPSPARSQASSAGSSNGGDSPDENSHLFGHFDNGQFISTMDVPIDKDNPRRCTACGKIFQNHFGVKTHYQNVHLKLMHKCNVDGCNAAFPSKRSRDRHSANLNLHRKLLSTSSDKSTASLFLEKSPFASLANNPALHGDILARIYAEEALKGHHLPPHPSLDQLMLNGDRIPPPPLLLPPLSGLAFPLGNLNHFSQLNGASITTKKEKSSSNSSTPTSPSPTNTSPDPTILIHCVEEDVTTPDKDGNPTCRLCRASFNCQSQLKEHCEKHHLAEMFRCTVAGCCKVFISRTKRNVHAENELLHSSINRIGSDRNVS